jgi:hypothetical protein
MRRINKFLQEETPLQEGFRAGKTPEMIVKLMNVIGKRARISDIKVSPVPDYYANKYGSFIGFFVKYNGSELLRFNFLKNGSSNKFYSIDKYNLKKMKPDYTIDLKGFNVVEVVSYISDILTGEFWQYAESTINGRTPIQEATFPQRVADWLNQNSQAQNDLKRALDSRNRQKIKNELERYLPSFQRYLSDNNLRGSINSEHAFRYAVRDYFKNEGGTNVSEVPAVEVIEGSPENLTSPSSQQQQAYDELMENEHIFKFKALRLYCNQIKKGNDNFKSLYIYGDGGIGKTFWVKKILDGLPQTKTLTGKISGYTGLVKVLYENRVGKILVLDDIVTDKDMNNPAVANILKAALDPDPPRRIEVVRGTASESSYHMGKFTLNEKDYKEFEDWKKELKEEVDFVDLTEPISADSPNEFLYDSITIFITNYKKVPQPIQDRCWILQMEFNNRQIIELIRESLKVIAPDADEDILDEAYELVDIRLVQEEVLNLFTKMEEHNLLGRKLSHRVFNRVVVLMSLGFRDEVFKHSLVRIELGN